ncbi:putative DNA polymerase subunit [Xanthomonas phage Xp15]|uniref:Putative DNA polymerase subunit n=1 Tax=Xanthomonas phage Xp15 TaxID=322855 RepID=Q52PN9_9CAUD|nr:putative DNA polymerase subunit [Xanthomonas phage Xp15]AAX84876.1 putative DNA polymerase subunit [Xanthomonas phage Xp15]
MAIILEGFDNSGKTSLSSLFGLPILHPGPRPRTLEAVLDCIHLQQEQATQHVVMDRVTAISHNAYCFDYPDPKYLFRRSMDLVQTEGVVLIYCRPPTEVMLDFSRHNVKDHDTEAHLAWLKKFGSEIIIRYDAIMSQLPHLTYDYTNPNPNIVSLALGGK